VELQAKLLRVLQEGEFERLGGTQTLRADVRLIAATHRDLTALVASGQFRSDLYYRLNVFPIWVPPLRERAEDIPALVMHYVRTFAAGMEKTLKRCRKRPWKPCANIPGRETSASCATLSNAA